MNNKKITQAQKDILSPEWKKTEQFIKEQELRIKRAKQGLK